MRGLSIGVHASQVPHAASAVFLGVAVQQLAPESAGGNADPVAVARHRSEIADDQDFIAGDRPLRSREIMLAAVSLQSTHSKPAGSVSSSCSAGCSR